MRLLTKFIITTLVFGFAGFLLNPAAPLGEALWGSMPEGPEPVGVQLPLLMLYTALSSFAMGFGIAYWAFAMRWTRQVFPSWTVAAHVAVGWIPATFWIHDSLHMMNGENMAGLIALEYGFHIPTILAGVIIATATVRGVQERKVRPAYASA